jgi:pimeloyl-ACP methyl ester carboxylesterase
VTSLAPPLLVLHELCDPLGGSPWRAAAVAAGWPGEVLAPDLPGHAGAAPPLGGNYELADPAFVAARLSLDGTPVVVGVGASGWAAQLLALGGRALALVLVDGLGAPWLEPRESVAARRRHIRALAGDDEAMSPPPRSSHDPRLRHALEPHASRSMAARAMSALRVPVLVLETPSSATPPGDAHELGAACPGGVTVVALDDGSPTGVASAVTSWFPSTDRAR